MSAFQPLSHRELKKESVRWKQKNCCLLSDYGPEILIQSNINLILEASPA